MVANRVGGCRDLPMKQRFCVGVFSDFESSASANSATPAQAIGSYEARVGAQVFATRSRGCKLRGGPKISRRMIASRKPDFDASKVAMSVLKSAPLATGDMGGA